MAKVPFTAGKKGSGRSGGWTSQGHVQAAGSSVPSTSNKLTHIGNLKKRMTGAGGSKGMPR